jgi:hypothetical protein
MGTNVPETHQSGRLATFLRARILFHSSRQLLMIGWRSRIQPEVGDLRPENRNLDISGWSSVFSTGGIDVRIRGAGLGCLRGNTVFLSARSLWTAVATRGG